MPPSESEVKCRDSFDAVLREALPSSVFHWDDGANPPDFDLRIDGEPYAVEVTKVMRTVRFGSKLMSMRAVVQHLVDLVAEAEQRIREANLLRGTFVAHCPRPIDRLTIQREAIVASIWNAVGSLWSEPAGESLEFYRQDGRSFRVTKVANDGAALYLGGPTDASWRGEATAELALLIEERIDAKNEALRKIKLPWILLLEDQYPYSDAAMYREFTSPLSGITEFEAVAMVRPEGSAVVLRSSIRGLPGLW